MKASTPKMAMSTRAPFRMTELTAATLAKLGAATPTVMRPLPALAMAVTMTYSAWSMWTLPMPGGLNASGVASRSV